MGLKGALSEPQEMLRSRYAEGLEAHRARRFDDARRSFDTALAAVPGDGPSIAMLKRVEAMQADPPASGWDGTWNLESNKAKPTQ